MIGIMLCALMNPGDCEHAQLALGAKVPWKHRMLFKSQQVAHLQEDASQHKDIDLQHIWDVNQHEGLLLLPTEYV